MSTLTVQRYVTIMVMINGVWVNSAYNTLFPPGISFALARRRNFKKGIIENFKYLQFSSIFERLVYVGVQRYRNAFKKEM